MIVTFDSIIENYKQAPAKDTDALQKKLVDHDITYYDDTLILEPGDTDVYVQNYISDFASYEPLYFVIDDSEILIKNKTRFLTFMSPFKPFIIRNKTNKLQELRFKKYFMKMSNIHDITSKKIVDSDILYYCGSYCLK